jgi:GNAT superfamily N-acetyltransferase
VATPGANQAGATHTPGAGSPVLEVRGLWVAQQWRRRGVATALMDGARAHAVMGRAPAAAEVAWAPWLPEAAHFAAAYCGGRARVLALALPPG